MQKQPEEGGPAVAAVGVAAAAAAVERGHAVDAAGRWHAGAQLWEPVTASAGLRLLPARKAGCVKLVDTGAYCKTRQQEKTAD